MELLKNRLENYKNFSKDFKKHSSKKIKSFYEMLKDFSTTSFSCINNDNILNDFIKITSAVKVDSVNADVVFGITTETEIAIKKIPIDSDEISYLKNLNKLDNIKPKDIKNLNSDLLTELYFLNITTKLLKRKITNNLPFIYTYYMCNKCHFTNKKVIEKKGTGILPCVYLITEKASGDLEHFILEKKTTEKQIYSGYLQIYIALYVIKKYFKIQHQDLHLGNVLYFKVTPGGYWKYRIKNKTIYVPNYGQLFILWDFAYSIIPELVGADSNKRIYDKGDKLLFEDHRRIVEGLAHNNHRFDKVHDFFYEIINNEETVHDIIFKLYEKLQKLDPLPSNIKVLESYNTNKKLE
jgi:hypothetical protein